MAEGQKDANIAQSDVKKKKIKGDKATVIVLFVATVVAIAYIVSMAWELFCCITGVNILDAKAVFGIVVAILTILFILLSVKKNKPVESKDSNEEDSKKRKRNEKATPMDILIAWLILIIVLAIPYGYCLAKVADPSIEVNKNVKAVTTHVWTGGHWSSYKSGSGYQRTYKTYTLSKIKFVNGEYSDFIVDNSSDIYGSKDTAYIEKNYVDTNKTIKVNVLYDNKSKSVLKVSSYKDSKIKFYFWNPILIGIQLAVHLLFFILYIVVSRKKSRVS